MKPEQIYLQSPIKLSILFLVSLSSQHHDVYGARLVTKSNLSSNISMLNRNKIHLHPKYRSSFRVDRSNLQSLCEIRGGLLSTSNHPFDTNNNSTDKSSLESPSETGNKSNTLTTAIENKKEFDFGLSSHESLLSYLNITSETTKQGLSSAEVQSRLTQHGPNILVSPPAKSIFQLIISQFEDRLVQILVFVALFSALFSYFDHMEDVAHVASTTHSWLQSFIEPIVILSILILNAIVGVWQEKSAEGSLDTLKKMQPSLAVVMRDGVWLDNIDAKDLVPGDIIRLRVGDKVRAFFYEIPLLC